MPKVAAPILAPDSTVVIDPLKPGVQTTEFWISALAGLSALAAQYSGVIPAPYGVIVATLTAAIYTCARAYVKVKVTEAVATVAVAENEADAAASNAT